MWSIALTNFKQIAHGKFTRTIYFSLVNGFLLSRLYISLYLQEKLLFFYFLNRLKLLDMH